MVWTSTFVWNGSVVDEGFHGMALKMLWFIHAVVSGAEPFSRTQTVHIYCRNIGFVLPLQPAIGGDSRSVSGIVGTFNGNMLVTKNSVTAEDLTCSEDPLLAVICILQT
jgi:hypothetical protein